MSEFTVAGVSCLNGQMKVRFATSIDYVEKLAKAGNVDIMLLEAPNAMTREQLTEWLKTTVIYDLPGAKAVIDAKSTGVVVPTTGKSKQTVTKTTKAVKTTEKDTTANRLCYVCRRRPADPHCAGACKSPRCMLQSMRDHC